MNEYEQSDVGGITKAKWEFLFFQRNLHQKCNVLYEALMFPYFIPTLLLLMVLIEIQC